MSFGGGSGGGGSIATDDDVTLSNPTDQQVLTYDGTSSKWINATPASGGGAPGEVALDSFSGANDDAKLAAAMSYASAQAHPPVIRLSNRDYSFSASITPYTGFRLCGPAQGVSNSELSNPSMGCKVQLSTNGNWLNVAGGDVYDVLISGITFIGGSSTTFLGCDGSSIWHCCHLRDVSFHQFKSVLGTQSQKLLMTASLIDGWFQMQGMYNGGIHIGGSDNRLFMDTGLVDGSQAYNTAGNAAGQYHFWFDGLDNTMIGPLYITATGLWGGIRVTGAAYDGGVVSNRGMLWLYGITNEGQSASLPCYGALLRVEGGIVKWNNGYIARGMSNPSAMGHSPQDAGVVHVEGGYLSLSDVTYDRCNGVAESVPFVYVNGGVVRVRDVSVATTGGSWTGLPQVTAPGGSLTHDDTVTQV